MHISRRSINICVQRSKENESKIKDDVFQSLYRQLHIEANQIAHLFLGGSPSNDGKVDIIRDDSNKANGRILHSQVDTEIDHDRIC